MTPLEHAECMRLTADAIERLDRNGNRIPSGYRLEYKGRYPEGVTEWSQAYDAPTRIVENGSLHYRLVELPKPKMVPLGPEDVIAGKSVLRIGDVTATVLTVGKHGVGYIGLATFHSITAPYQWLQDRGATIDKHGDGNFAKCEKPEPCGQPEQGK